MTTPNQPGAKPVPIFIAVKGSTVVMRGGEFIASAVSHTMARRIANALNWYKPNDKGV